MSDSGTLIRDWRNRQQPRVTLSELAGSIGLSKVSMSRIETGRQAITAENALKLSERTGIAVGQLCPDLARMFAPQPAGAAQ